MKNDEELDLLLGEIPHEISLNHGNIQHHPYPKHGHCGGDHHHLHHNGAFRTQKTNAMMYGKAMYGDDDTLTHYYPDKHTCASPVSGLSLHSDASSSSFNSFSDYGSPTSAPLEELKPLLFGVDSKNCNRLRTELKSFDSSIRRKAGDNVLDEIHLARNMPNLRIGEHPVDGPYKSSPGLFSDCNISGTVQFDPHFPDFGTYQLGEMSSGMVRQQNLYCQGNVFRLPHLYSLGQADDKFLHLDSRNSNACYQLPTTKGFAGHHYYKGLPLLSLFGPVDKNPVSDVRFCTQLNDMTTSAETGAFGMPNLPRMIPRVCHNNYETVLNRQQPMSNNYCRLPCPVGMHYGSLEGLTSEDSLIFEGEGINCATNVDFRYLKGRNTKNIPFEPGMSAHPEKRSQLDGCPRNLGSPERSRCLRMYSPLPPPPPLKGTLLVETQGYIYHIAKDQQGCRFLQRVFDEGTPQDLQIVFNGIIDHVVELMMNPFGNYLMQKLLEVCNEEQRLQILVKVTAKAGELIRISLNTHGTRVVQKLIETVKSRQQISLIISALQPGFLALIKDLNGNHVVQRCLQCLTNEDSKFIFIAAAKYCVDIATHPHGCCVLQRCISHSTGKLRENLIAEISSNGLLLAQDAFGNYVVQFILELKMPSATTKLVSQFDGNYVHLSAQKFSSHVVEKCLLACNKEIQSKIIHELLSATQFEQLLQDPHANYVVQTALKVSEGPLHNALVDKIESHKAISRNSPYSKRIFSHKLLKK